MRRLAYALAFLTCGCVSARDHIGHWEHKDDGEFVRVELQHDGKCTIFMGGKTGNFWEGIGGRCLYTHDNRRVSITEVGDLKGNRPYEKMPEPFILEYSSNDDSILFTGKRPKRMVRIASK